MAGSLNKYLAELLGTFVLIGVGSMAVLSSGGNIVAIALGFGLAVLAAIYMFGAVSGAHVNPALTFARLLRGEISGADLVGYVVAQLAGALLASGLVAAVAGVGGVEQTVPAGGRGIEPAEAIPSKETSDIYAIRNERNLFDSSDQLDNIPLRFVNGTKFEQP